MILLTITNNKQKQLEKYHVLIFVFKVMILKSIQVLVIGRKEENSIDESLNFKHYKPFESTCCKSSFGKSNNDFNNNYFSSLVLQNF